MGGSVQGILTTMEAEHRLTGEIAEDDETTRLMDLWETSDITESDEIYKKLDREKSEKEQLDELELWMELKDEVRSSFKRSHNLARKYCDCGNLSKARVEYLKCARFAEHLSELTPSKRKEFHERAKKFREIAEGLKVGDIKVYTDGIVPEEAWKSSKPRTADDSEGREDRAKGIILAEKPSLKFKAIASR